MAHRGRCTRTVVGESVQIPAPRSGRESGRVQIRSVRTEHFCVVAQNAVVSVNHHKLFPLSIKLNNCIDVCITIYCAAYIIFPVQDVRNTRMVRWIQEPHLRIGVQRHLRGGSLHANGLGSHAQSRLCHHEMPERWTTRKAVLQLRLQLLSGVSNPPHSLLLLIIILSYISYIFVFLRLV